MTRDWDPVPRPPSRAGAVAMTVMLVALGLFGAGLTELAIRNTDLRCAASQGVPLGAIPVVVIPMAKSPWD